MIRRLLSRLAHQIRPGHRPVVAECQTCHRVVVTQDGLCGICHKTRQMSRAELRQAVRESYSERSPDPRGVAAIFRAELARRNRIESDRFEEAAHVD